jgi:hypothetical protein
MPNLIARSRLTLGAQCGTMPSAIWPLIAA